MTEGYHDRFFRQGLASQVMKESYRHTQYVNPVLLILPLAAVITTFVLAIAVGGNNLMLWACAVFLGIAIWLFSSLTVEVTPTVLKWHYGPGLIGWRCSLNEIESANCEQDVAHWVWRWGVRLEPYGYLYSISGGETVRIRLKNGKQFGIRTRESEALIRAISDRT